MEKCLYSSKSDDWETPKRLFSAINSIMCFDFDACANAENTKCDNFISKEINALEIDWNLFGSKFWLNPPYGKEIGQFLEAAEYESKFDLTGVALVPARTDTNWWFDYAVKHPIIFLKDRLKFSGSKQSAPFPLALIVYDTDRMAFKISDMLSNSWFPNVVGKFI